MKVLWGLLVFLGSWGWCGALGALNTEGNLVFEVEQAFAESGKPAGAKKYQELLKGLEGKVFTSDSRTMGVAASDFKAQKSGWTLSLRSQDPALPYFDRISLAADTGARGGLDPNPQGSFVELLEKNQLRARLNYQLAFVPQGKKPLWNLRYLSVEVGSGLGESFQALRVINLSQNTYYQFTAATRMKPQEVNPAVAVLPKAKGVVKGQILLYGRPSCGNCQAMEEDLKAQNLKYTYFNIDKDASKRNEMWSKLRAAKGNSLSSVGLPVMEVSGQMLIAPDFSEVKALAASAGPSTPNKPPVNEVKPNKPTPSANSGATAFSKAALAELNLARTNPKAYAEKRLKDDFKAGKDNGAYKDFLGRSAVGPLKYQKQLETTAQKYAEFLASKDKFGHEADGRTPFQRMKADGYNYRTAGENLACGSWPDQNAEKSPEKSAVAFVKQLIIDQGVPSLGHRENIMNGKFTEVGLGFGRNPSSRYQNYHVQNFGTPR